MGCGVGDPPNAKTIYKKKKKKNFVNISIDYLVCIVITNTGCINKNSGYSIGM
jgi:hypothetical protein